jgi:hypothetical protein
VPPGPLPDNGASTMICMPFFDFVEFTHTTTGPEYHHHRHNHHHHHHNNNNNNWARVTLRCQIQAHANIIESRFAGCVFPAAVRAASYCVLYIRVLFHELILFPLISPCQANATPAILATMQLRTILQFGPIGCCAVTVVWNSLFHPNHAVAGLSWPRAAP